VSQQRLPVRKIREVLRLKAAGLSDRKIAASIGSARSTVHECVRRASEAGLMWPLADEFDETGPDPITIGYDAMGNIASKTGVGSYTYHATKKHAVTAAGSYSFAYDANGNVSTRNGSTISWYSYNLPNTISASGSNSSQFFYAPDRSRWKQVASYSGTNETTVYIGGLIEKVSGVSLTSWRHFISGGSGPVAVYTRKSSGVNEIHYLTRDHLGSVDSVTTGTGAVEVRLSFASFGQRRKEAGWSGNPTSGDWTEIADSTRRGYTTHEMLDNLSLVHMNGRVYDPVVGRFLSADPYIQAPGFTQSFNRYSYTWNNPLSFTDPSGFFEEYAKVVCKDGCYSYPGGYAWHDVGFAVWGRPLWNPVIAVPPGAASTPRDPPPAPDPPPPPPQPPADPIDEKVNVSVTSVPCEFMPCGSTADGPSYARRIGVTARGIAVGLFGAAVALIAATPDAELFYDFGSALYDDSILADDFQTGHNFGYVLGFGSLLGGAKVSQDAPVVTQPYVRPSGTPTRAQRASVQGQPCIDCGTTAPRQVADHKRPLVEEYYETGTINLDQARSLDAVQAQCPTCSARQGAHMSRYSREKREELGLDD